MPRHRSLSLNTFVKAVPWDLFQRYFDQLQPDTKPSGWEFINAKAMEAFLSVPRNAEVRESVLEDFQRINDLCSSGMNLLVRAYRRVRLDFDQQRPAQELAMRLFLNHREAFNYAWSRYLLYHSGSKSSCHRIFAPQLEVRPEHVTKMETVLTEWFTSHAKGEVCNVRHFDDQGENVFLVSHGSYLRHVAYWKGKRVVFQSFRPACEDVLVYDRERLELTVKAALEKDRDQYLQVFAKHVAGDESLVQRAQRNPVFSLAPLQDGSFGFGGNDTISEITLVSVRLKMYGATSPVVEIRSEDVLKTLKEDLSGLSLRSGEIAAARFRLKLNPEGERSATVTFEIAPPGRTDLAQKLYAKVIERYLIEQGVKLR